MSRRFHCPCCNSGSSHPEDYRRGYCGRCHAWTGDPDVMLRVLDAAYAAACAGQAPHVPPYTVDTGPDGEFVCRIPPATSPLGRHVIAGDARRRWERGAGFDDLRTATAAT